MLTHSDEPPSFKSNKNIPGGSKGGDKRPLWPLIFKLAADALAVQHYGTIEALMHKPKRPWSFEEFRRRLEVALPGCYEYRLAQYEPGKTFEAVMDDWWNRVYKMYYFGKSAGNTGEPYITISPEHWKNWRGAHWVQLHDTIRRGGQVLHWELWI